jgi:hypothetical protein
MVPAPDGFSLLARELIEQCRREIAAAWEQIAAGRRILERSRWLMTRWAGQAAAAALVRDFDTPRRSMGGSYKLLQEAPRRPCTIAQAAAQVLGGSHRHSMSAGTSQ